jgi:hypothetical protein
MQNQRARFLIEVYMLGGVLKQRIPTDHSIAL